MEQYISKAALVAEIERRIKAYQENFDKADNKIAKLFADGLIQGLESFLAFLDTFEVKEIGVDLGDPQGDIGVNWVQEKPVINDLEEAADKHLVEKGYLLTTNNGEHLAEVEAKGLFKAGAQWQKTKACKWLREHKEHPLIGCEDPCLSGYLTDAFIEEFKKAMEE